VHEPKSTLLKILGIFDNLLKIHYTAFIWKNQKH